MKKATNFWHFVDWFTNEVNQVTMFHSITDIQARRFAFILADNYKKMRPVKHGWFNRIDVNELLRKSLEDYTSGEKYLMSPDVKGAIVKVVKKKLFGFYPFTYKEVDRLMNLMYE